MTILLDVEHLKATPSAEAKEQIASKVSGLLRDEKFDDNEKKIALEVIKLLAHDTEIKVRRMLAENLKECNVLPRDIALKLAKDIAEVATPILQFSIVLSQNDLIEIVRSAKQVAAIVAVAKRNDIEEALATALIETREEEVVQTLAGNDNAAISPANVIKILTYFKHSRSVLSTLIERGDLPFTIAERMLAMVTKEMQAYLSEKYHKFAAEAGQVVKDTHENATLYLISNSNNLHQTIALIEHLHENQKLSNSLVLRALCKGDLPFFEMGLAKMASISHAMAHDLIWRQGPAGFAALYKKASMPKGTFNAVNVIVQFALQEVKEGERADESYAKRMIERITLGGYHKRISIMEYFMVLMKSKVNPIDIVQIEV